MRRIIYLLPLMLMYLLSACENNFSETVTYPINEPVFMNAAQFRAKVKVTNEARAIKKQGKISFYEGFLFISEPNEGIHIIDNRNPSNPENVGFIELTGNADMAIRDNLLYADSYIDLVWFDITNPQSPQFAGRIDSIFPDALPPVDNNYSIDYNMCFGEKRQPGIIVGWKVTERTESISHYTGGGFWPWGGDVFYDSATASENGGGSKNGINGSMSRFALYDDKLYTVIRDYMSIFDLSGEAPVKAADNIFIGWNVETLFSYEDNMFMGTPTGMLIYSVADPLKPEFMSSVTHVFGCDPVVVHNDLAYVTVHSGNMCGQNVNELFIVDVSNVREPKKLITFEDMTKPKGLGIDNEMLFLCDDGLKIFNITTPEKSYLSSVKHIKGMEGYDLIAWENVLMMIAEDGLYQYDYSDVNDIKALSVIKFTNNE